MQRSRRTPGNALPRGGATARVPDPMAKAFAMEYTVDGGGVGGLWEAEKQAHGAGGRRRRPRPQQPVRLKVRQSLPCNHGQSSENDGRSQVTTRGEVDDGQAL
jgi:hypothetical protein